MSTSCKTYQKDKSENASIFENDVNMYAVFPLFEKSSENEKIQSSLSTCERQPISVENKYKNPSLFFFF